MTVKQYLEKTASKKHKAINFTNVPCRGLPASKFKGFTCSQENDTGKYFIRTHRARSKSYDSLSKVPVSVQKFIDSTG